MSIEFGILREGSTITIIGEYRVVLSDTEWLALGPMFQKIGALTGQEMEWWGDAEFDSNALPFFVNEVEVALKKPEFRHEREILVELLRVANHAYKAGKTLSFLGD